MSLGGFLYNGYNDRTAQENELKTKGFNKVSSTKKSQTFYNPQSEVLIKNVSGTRDLTDWQHNFRYALTGNVKDSRYTEEKNDLEKNRKKYNPKGGVILTGHSRGGLLARAISNPTDKVITSNAPSHLFNDQPRNNETHYRTRGDVVSILSANNKNTKTLKPNFTPSSYPNSTVNLISNSLKAHRTSTIPKTITII